MRKNAAPQTRGRNGATSNAILDVAERLAQKRGFNGFSYADVSAKLGITKAAIHYHFASKGEMGRALIERYHEAFAAALETVAAERASPTALRRYVDLYDAVLRENRMCLCGMFAAEYATLPAPMQSALRRFFDLNVRWLSSVLEEGRNRGELVFDGTPLERAELALSALEGAMLVARACKDERRFRAVADQIVSGVVRKVSAG